MDSVEVKKDELLVKLRENRANHINLYGQAMAGYREEVILTLKVALAKAEEHQDIGEFIHLPAKPESHEFDYNRVIRMLEMSLTSQDAVEVDRLQFQQYVMDEWSWAPQFKAMSEQYTGRSPEKGGGTFSIKGS